MSFISDEQLVKQYLLGDEKSLELLIARYLKPIYGFVFRYVGDGEAAEDITQEVFVKMWRNLKKFKREKKFSTWFFAIAKNSSVDWLRKKKAIPFSSFQNEKGENALFETLADSGPLPDELFERTGLSEMLDKALQQLSPAGRAVLFLRYNDHFNFREIAEMFEESINTVKSRHRRALILLQKFLSVSPF